MDVIRWCKKKKKGIRMIYPNDNLADAYLFKAEDALETMNSITSSDWRVSTAYYAMYYSLYAILMKAGIKSEIHTCTIECMKVFFDNFFSEKDVELMEKAKSLRVESQYYVQGPTVEADVSEIAEAAPAFVIKCRHICGRIKTEDIEAIRDRIQA